MNTTISHPRLARSRVIWGGALLALWLIATTVAIYWLTFNNYGEFDPQQAWLGWLPPEGIARDIGISNHHEETTLAVVTEDGCSCNSFLRTHLNDMRFDNQALHTMELAPATLNEHGFIVPATPMAMVFYGDELVYAGPFATGPFCASEDSLLVGVIERKQTLAGTFLNGFVNACRCT